MDSVQFSQAKSVILTDIVHYSSRLEEYGKVDPSLNGPMQIHLEVGYRLRVALESVGTSLISDPTQITRHILPDPKQDFKAWANRTRSVDFPAAMRRLVAYTKTTNQKALAQLFEEYLDTYDVVRAHVLARLEA